MSSICQAWTRVSGGVAACTAEKDVAMVTTMAADIMYFGMYFIDGVPHGARAPFVRWYECKSGRFCPVFRLVLKW